jgi:hypothetical protein
VDCSLCHSDNNNNSILLAPNSDGVAGTIQVKEGTEQVAQHSEDEFIQLDGSILLEIDPVRSLDINKQEVHI